ncbi:MAG: Gfo/Idh/MocA family oxidoreductase [Ruminococcaceae bacterium]|nr:Gfo/Idh/MocA family oxidoreductase [Oscillospiraceae bacterium]
MQKVRFGIVGIGNMGTAHCKSFLEGKIANGVLTAICNKRTSKMDAILALDGAEDVVAFTDYKELLHSGLCDAIIVAVPPYDHATMVTEALEAGLHVICEKPAGVYTKQVKEMNAVAARSDKLFGMMFNQRSNPIYRQMQQMVADGDLGEIKRVNWIITNWYRSQNYFDIGGWRATWKGEGGGVLFNQCPHQIDLLQWIVGMLPTKIHAHCHFGKWHDIEVEDDVTAYMEFPNGATGVFVTSTADAPGTNRFEITGTRGRLVCENDRLMFDRLKVDEREFCRTARAFVNPEYRTCEIVTLGSNDQHVGIINNFANAILGIEPLFVKGEEGIRSVQMMNAMLLSTWLDRAVELPIDDELYLEELDRRIAASTATVKESADVVLDISGSYGGVK